MSSASLQPEIYQINCIVEGQGTLITVEIATNKTVYQLKEAIKTKRSPVWDHLAADELTLYRVDIQEPGNARIEALKRKIVELKKNDALDPLSDMKDVYPDSDLPKRRVTHILVQIPENSSTSSAIVLTRSEEEEAKDTLGPLPKKPRPKIDRTEDLITRWRLPVAVSDVVDLLGHIQTPLQEDEKVPISQEDFDYLVRKFELTAHNISLKAEDVSKLFRVSNDEEARPIVTRFMNSLDLTDWEAGTEESFIYGWDASITRIIKTILLKGTPIRNSNHNTNTALKRPDSGFLVNQHCLFRGEEKRPNSKEDPKSELVAKLVNFSYQPLKFILGYYAIGSQVNYVAITQQLTTEPLFNHDLESKTERLINLVHLIRLCGALSWMSEQLGPRENPEYIAMKRPGDVEVTIGAVVKKLFKQPDAASHVIHLQAVYELLKRKGVPNTDELIEISISPGGFPSIYTRPVGKTDPPSTGAELFKAVMCILQALKVMHAEPNPVYHRDIREPNIIKRHDRDEWFLIDWSDASMAPTKASTTFVKETHSPRAFENNHGGEVDVWGVGRYLRHFVYQCKLPEPDKVLEIARKWMGDHTITAAVALDELERSRRFLIPPA